MKQLTIRGFSPELERILTETARRRGTSLNRAAIHLMRRGARLRDPGDEPQTIGSALDRYAGSWPPSEAEQIDDAVQELDRVTDREFWQ